MVCNRQACPRRLIVLATRIIERYIVHIIHQMIYLFQSGSSKVIQMKKAW